PSYFLFLIRDLLPNMLTINTLEIAIKPPINERVSGHSFNHTQAIRIATAGSISSIIDTFVALPNERAIDQVVQAIAARRTTTNSADKEDVHGAIRIGPQ